MFKTLIIITIIKIIIIKVNQLFCQLELSGSISFTFENTSEGQMLLLCVFVSEVKGNCVSRTELKNWTSEMVVFFLLPCSHKSHLWTQSKNF